jgi:hypothetical protein
VKHVTAQGMKHDVLLTVTLRQVEYEVHIQLVLNTTGCAEDSVLVRRDEHSIIGLHKQAGAARQACINRQVLPTQATVALSCQVTFRAEHVSRFWH